MMKAQVHANPHGSRQHEFSARLRPVQSVVLPLLPWPFSCSSSTYGTLKAHLCKAFATVVVTKPFQLPGFHNFDEILMTSNLRCYHGLHFFIWYSFSVCCSQYLEVFKASYFKWDPLFKVRVKSLIRLACIEKDWNHHRPTVRIF